MKKKSCQWHGQTTFLHWHIRLIDTGQQEKCGKCKRSAEVVAEPFGPVQRLSLGTSIGGLPRRFSSSAALQPSNETIGSYPVLMIAGAEVSSVVREVQERATIPRERLCIGVSEPSKIRVGRLNLSILDQHGFRRATWCTLSGAISSQG